MILFSLGLNSFLATLTSTPPSPHLASILSPSASSGRYHVRSTRLKLLRPSSSLFSSNRKVSAEPSFESCSCRPSRAGTA
ncbi:hypothetical protein DFJ74DRAFT_652634 [Hyaloraphidium curvatum]|nr:hypothetical protein DFJ74DRAFT_652634 [Hyaloraphidium curvatum]